MITYEDFAKLDLRIAKVLSCERVEGSEKLLKLQVDLNEPDLPAGRQVIAGIGKVYDPESLVGKSIVIVANLEPRTMMGVESQGMLLAAGDVDNLSILTVEKEIASGTKVK